MTSDDAYRIELAAVERFVNDLVRFATTVDERIRALDRRIDDLHLDWSGEGVIAHRDAHHRWKEGVADIREAIVEVRKAANRSHSAFGGLQEHQRKMWP
ncbi:MULTISPECIES: WXG100 family type VII secretion target [Gordonia]|uniref:WXG100 family type VII secretion target n=1 Tax=Gordonia TaxID=2053 RepID=UPI0005868FB5|nr:MULTISPECIES: WXG100 family type VII secretion target [Gordonia]MDV7175925.1 WXG100 family type VII secretion target [Gordonia amicalis]NKX79741.1 WXG100 family type VII secretion target [Gordonia amicalis]